MPQILTPDTFEFFARYLLAGYIVIIVRSRFILGVRPKPTELVVEAIIFSLIVQFLALLLTWLAIITGLLEWLFRFSTVSKTKDEIGFFLSILVLPTALGMVFGWNLNFGWRSALLRRLSMPVVHPVQRAYDFAFGVERRPGLVIVSYEDGTEIRGYFGENSLASSDSNRSDIYLEQLYLVDDDGNWFVPNPPRSAVLSLVGARSIEFFETEGEANA